MHRTSSSEAIKTRGVSSPCFRSGLRGSRYFRVKEGILEQISEIFKRSLGKEMVRSTEMMRVSPPMYLRLFEDGWTWNAPLKLQISFTFEADFLQKRESESEGVFLLCQANLGVIAAAWRG
ncbi:hypothetical protein WN943_000734 [Citrus x changshan-huyou]